MASTGAQHISYRRDGLLFRATVTGAASTTPVVLLHGFPGSRETWAGTADVLRDAGVSSVALEQRGYGAGARPSAVAAYRLPELASDVCALLDHLDVARCHLVGHDWGGAVAWYLGATEPERCASLTVLSTPHPRAFASAMLRSTQALRSTYALAFQLPLLPEAILTAGRGRLLRASLVASGLDRRTAGRYATNLAKPGAMRAALSWYRASFRHPNDARAVGPISIPTTYAWSTGDTALGRAAAEATGAHVQAPYRFVILDGLSHWIPETAPQRAAELILSRIEAPS